MTRVKHLSTAELDAGLSEIRRSPKDNGVLAMIVRRQRIEDREVLQEVQLASVSCCAGGGHSLRIQSTTCSTV